MVMETAWETLASVAVRIAVWGEVWVLADCEFVSPVGAGMETEKTALIAPADTMTLDGALTIALLLLRPTTAPPVGAALVSVTVQAEDPPMETVVGEQESELN